MKYDYYLQKDPLSLRRYPQGQDIGERWAPDEQRWTKHCAERQACVQTQDEVITEQEALKFTSK